MSSRKALHRLVDDLPENELPAASRMLTALRDAEDRASRAVDGVALETSGRSNGLARFAGTWSREEFEEFEAAIAETEQIDEELWR